MKFLIPFFTWLRSVYSESDGTGSSTRVLISAMVGFILGVGISFCYSVHHKGITVDQFDTFLSTGATFLVTVCGVLYGINRGADALSNKKPQ